MKVARVDRGNVVIAGGGTGGHIYPGLAVAKVLQDQGYIVHWVGATGGLEEKIVVRAELPLHLIRVGKLHSSVGIAAQLKTLVGLPLAFFQALRLALKLKPVAVLGVGGFASGPFLFVASMLGFRTVIWEPNAHVGMANRILSRFADECLLVFEAAATGFRSENVQRVGLPVRESIQPVKRGAYSGRPFRILVFGGSQGARPINRVVAEWIESGGGDSRDLEVVHQTGRYDFAEIDARYAKLKSQGRAAGITCLEYLHDMEARYEWADVVVCRSGASTVAEIAMCGKAAIFIPLPTAADNHQLKNADVLSRANAAVLIEQKDLTPASLESTIRRLRDNPTAVLELEKNVVRFASPGAAIAIAGHVIGHDPGRERGREKEPSV